MTLLEGRGLTRRFGTFTAVDGVDVAVAAGEVVGLLGANGAGKTTLIRMLLGLLGPSAGEVRLLDGPPDRRARARIGYVAQAMGLYTDLTVAQNARFHAEAFGGDRSDAPAGTRGDDRLVGDLSLGEQRRLAFALAVAHDPALLVLDEPTSGVGPLGRARLWDAVHDAADDGRGVLVTTHYLSEAEQCDRLVVMAAGRIVAAGTLDDVVGGSRAVQVDADSPARLLGLLAEAGMVAALSAGGVAVPGARIEEVQDVVTRARVDARVRERPATLEERFVELAGAVAR